VSLVNFDKEWVENLIPESSTDTAPPYSAILLVNVTVVFQSNMCELVLQAMVPPVEYMALLLLNNTTEFPWKYK